MYGLRLLVLTASLFECGHSQELVNAPQFGKHYFAGGGRVDFASSKAYCERHHGQLVRIDSVEEERFVRTFLQDRDGTATSTGVNAQKVKGRYVWPNGDEVRIRNWRTGYRDCSASCCRLFLDFTGGWWAYPCDFACTFVCEITQDVLYDEQHLSIRNFKNWTVSEIENLKVDNVALGRIVSRLAQDNQNITSTVRGNQMVPSKYFLTDKVYNISLAIEFCESHNGHLAIVGSQWEGELIGYLKRDTKPWIGLKRVNGTFKWLGKYDIEYANWNPAAALYTLEELLRMQAEVTPDMSMQERMILLSRTTQKFAIYREKFGEEIVECLSVYVESDGTWNVDKCSASRYGICERKTWMETKAEEKMKIREAKHNRRISELEWRLEQQNTSLEMRLENQKRETQQQFAELMSDFNEMKQKFA